MSLFTRGGGIYEDGLACRCHCPHRHLGARRRYGGDDLALPTRARPFDGHTAIAERQAKAMAASGIMDHNVAGSFASRVSGAHLGMAAENIAAGTKTWAETFRMWQNSPGHNANLLLPPADSVGVAVARNNDTQYKTFWAMVIADKSPKRKDRKAGVGTSENAISTVKHFVCKYLC
jgi:hypothetical protein